jgi:alkylhydroperoxidase family enzyme
MSARIPPVSQPDEEQRELLAKTLPTPDGRPLNLFATLAHRPRLLRRVNALGGYFMAHSAIGAREREIVILRVGSRAASEYEIAQHRRLGEEAGLSPPEIDALLDQDAQHAWSRDDQALVDLVDELTGTGTVSDEVWDALGARYDEFERMELLVLAGFYRMLAGLLNGLRVEVEDGGSARPT